MRFYEKYGKRMLDFTLSALGLILLSPFFALIAYRIRSEDGGNIFYRGIRVGKEGAFFKIFKFRTMVMDADRIGGPSTSEDDSRVTPLGRTLRRYKLDEFPQLINVLKGEMSLVGPRPEVPEYVDMYTPEEEVILSVRPGITDWASVWNPDEGAFLSKFSNPDRAYLEIIRPKKLELQKKYVSEISFATDIRIIMRTIRSVVDGKEAGVFAEMKDGVPADD